MGDKYLGLSNFLSKNNKERVELSFTEVENILKFQLPNSARNHKEWWENTLSHSQAHAWRNGGYEVESPKTAFDNQKVVFIKIKP